MAIAHIVWDETGLSGFVLLDQPAAVCGDKEPALCQEIRRYHGVDRVAVDGNRVLVRVATSQHRLSAEIAMFTLEKHGLADHARWAD